jgi:small neutral amino acid transporter SnatA (MarC family)
LRNSILIVRKVGPNVIEIFSKIIGLLIAAMAIEYILKGTFDWLQIHQAILLPNLIQIFG